MNNTDLNNLQNNEEYLDFLSSKYIDAELSLEEDNMLRNLINENPNLKENFFNNIDIYQSIKEESKNIEIPYEFLDETENLLVDRLFNKDVVLTNENLNENSDYTKYSNYEFQLDQLELLENDGNYFKNQNSKTNFINLTKNKSNKVFNRLTLVAACFLLFFVYNINEFRSKNQINSFVDLNFEINLDNELKDDLNNDQVNYENNITSNKFKSPSNLIENNNLLANPLESNNIVTKIDKVKNTEFENIESNVIANKNIDILPINNTNQSTQLEESPSTFSSSSNNSNNINSPIIQNTVVLNPINSQVINLNSKNNVINNSFVFDKENISSTFKLNSSISNDLGNSKFNEKNNAITSHYAQSIAIQIDENNDIGFEFGFSDFNFDDKANLTITTEIPNNTPGSNLKEYRTIIVPVELRKNYTMYWGLGFIEKNIFKYNDFTFNTKFALGFSNDGPQSYLRMSAKYELIKNLNVNIGLDGRYMNVNLPFYINSNNSKTTTALSLNYGIQYQF